MFLKLKLIQSKHKTENCEQKSNNINFKYLSCKDQITRRKNSWHKKKKEEKKIKQINKVGYKY